VTLPRHALDDGAAVEPKTAGFSIPYVQIGLLAYSLYSSRRAKKKARQQYRNTLQDRTVTIRSSDAPRDIVYGRVRKSGVIAYVVSPTPTQQYFAMVQVLAGHECDGLEAVFIGDERYAWDPTSGRLTAPTPGQFLRYARDDVSDELLPFTVNAARQINVGAGVGVISASAGATVDIFDVPVHGELGFTEQFDGALQPTGIVTIPGAAPGQTVYVITRKRTPRSWVRVKFYNGAPDQMADPELRAISPNGEWSANHQLRGLCYAVIFIDPDPAVFTEGLPEFSFVVRGRKVRLANGTIGWSRNSAECLRDYLTTYVRWPLATIDDTAFQAAKTACDEVVALGAPGSATIARYTCDGVIQQDETAHRENVQAIMTSMMGTLVPIGALAVMRAAAWTTPTITLGDDDLIGPAVIGPYQSGEGLFNSVRGRYFDGEDQSGVPAPGVTYTRSYQRLDFTPYRSQVYISQDGGAIEYDTIDLPFTVSAVRAQRLAKLHLFRERQSLRISATWKLSAVALQPGIIVRLKLSRYGWSDLDSGLGKAFRVLDVSYDFAGMQVRATMQEEAQAVYAWDYSEADGRDPAPNTSFPTWRDIAAPTGLQISSGGDYVKRRGDGTRQPFARVTWDQSTEPSVLSGGWLELEWAINDAAEWQRSGRLDPYTTAFHIVDAAANDLFRVRLRAVNLVAASPWAYRSAMISPLSGPGTSALGIGVGVNAVAGATLTSEDVGKFRFYYFPSETISTPLPYGQEVSFQGWTGSQFARSPSKVIVLTDKVWSTGYGQIAVVEFYAGTIGTPTRGWVQAVDGNPAVPGDIWELQTYVSGSFDLRVDPALLYYDASDNLVGASFDQPPLVSWQNDPSPVKSISAERRDFIRTWSYVRIPPGVAIVRWCQVIQFDPAYVSPGSATNLVGGAAVFIAMPFAARCSIASEASLRANPLLYLTSWNG
jgi:hypothetical protein